MANDPKHLLELLLQSSKELLISAVSAGSHHPTTTYLISPKILRLVMVMDPQKTNQGNGGSINNKVTNFYISGKPTTTLHHAQD